MLLLARQLFLADDPTYRCGTKRNLTETHLLTVDKIDETLNQDGFIFNMTLFVSELNKASAKKISLSRTTVMVSDFILTWLQHTFHNLRDNLSPAQFSRALQNFIFFNSMFHVLKPVELLDLPHYHLRLPVKYYQAFFKYDAMLKNDKKLPLERLQLIFKLDNKKNCAHSTYSEFSASNSIEQLELQYFFLTRKFDTSKKAYTLEMLGNLVSSALEIVDKQSWIDQVTKTNVRVNIAKLQKQIAYSDIIDESIKDKHLNTELTNGQSDLFELTE